jgi:MFS family permease
MDQQVNEQNMRLINEVMNSWAVQAVFAALLVGLVIVAFGRASRVFDNDRRRRIFRVAVVVLIVFVVTQAAVTAAIGHVPLPIVVVVEFVCLSGLWFYYVVRLLTGQRSGHGDDESRRRGAALEEVIAPLNDEAHHTTGA